MDKPKSVMTMEQICNVALANKSSIVSAIQGYRGLALEEDAFSRAVISALAGESFTSDEKLITFLKKRIRSEHNTLVRNDSRCGISAGSGRMKLGYVSMSRSIDTFELVYEEQEDHETSEKLIDLLPEEVVGRLMKMDIVEREAETITEAYNLVFALLPSEVLGAGIKLASIPDFKFSALGPARKIGEHCGIDRNATAAAIRDFKAAVKADERLSSIVSELLK